MELLTPVGHVTKWLARIRIVTHSIYACCSTSHARLQIQSSMNGILGYRVYDNESPKRPTICLINQLYLIPGYYINCVRISQSLVLCVVFCRPGTGSFRPESRSPPESFRPYSRSPRSFHPHLLIVL